MTSTVSGLLKLSVVSGGLVIAFSLPTFSKECSLAFDYGKSLYTQKQYAKASSQFQRIINAGDKRPIVYLYLAHSYYSLNHRAKAIQTYKKIVNGFPGTGEAKIASSSLSRLGFKPKQSSKRSAGKRVVNATKPTEPSGTSLLESITIIPPKFGHPPVSQNTIRMVKGIIASLPKRMYRILDEGGAKLHIGPNMIDRWPDSLNARHPANGHLYCNEPGRTYDKNMYIFERPLARTGSKQLGKIWDEKNIKISVYIQCAHALDYMMEHLSNDREFQKLYNQDLSSMPSRFKSILRVETAGTRNGRIQTFAEIVVYEMGLHSQKGAYIKSAFPKTTMFVKESIKRIDLDKWTSK